MCDNFQVRRNALRRLLEKRCLDAILISYDANRYYLSGFELHDTQYNESSGYLIIGADGKEYIVTDSRFEEAAHRLFLPDSVIIYHQNSIDVVHSLLKKCGIRIGVEMKTLPFHFLKRLIDYSDLAIEPCDDLLERMRSIKDPNEVQALEKSFALNHTLLLWLEHELKPGLSEQDISWAIEKFFRENGASELAFPSIVAVGENAAMPHAIPGSRLLEENNLVLIDVGCRVDGYCSDQTRTFWVGEKQSDRFVETVRLVREAQEAAISSMHPGMAFRDVYKKAHAVFEKAGVSEFFTHGLGHGVGLETHERPSLSDKALGILEPGMVVTVEPGLYYKEWGGVRWEFTVLVEETGVRVL
ncbi:MAG: aminopeptidase P family protein [Desulfovibrio sp.]|nr:aminopeptidase P family protein [Desulfovibrio sp.]